MHHPLNSSNPDLLLLLRENSLYTHQYEREERSANAQKDDDIYEK